MGEAQGWGDILKMRDQTSYRLFGDLFILGMASPSSFTLHFSIVAATYATMLQSIKHVLFAACFQDL
jgi:hypothetical protein